MTDIYKWFIIISTSYGRGYKEMSEIKELLKQYELAVKASDKADKIYSADPDNEEKEIAFDEAYKNQFKIAEKIADEIVKLTDNGVTKKLAREMVWGGCDSLKRIFNV